MIWLHRHKIKFKMESEQSNPGKKKIIPKTVHVVRWKYVYNIISADICYYICSFFLSYIIIKQKVLYREGFTERNAYVNILNKHWEYKYLKFRMWQWAFCWLTDLSQAEQAINHSQE